jgi:glycosyltransferase involved in cell wall biosynthesis
VIRQAGDRLSVALDATPLLGVSTGVGVFCTNALAALAATGDLDVKAFAVTWRRRHMLAGRVPPGVRVVGRAMPARPLHLAWRHTEYPSIERFVGEADVVHGTNFVVPPAHRAARVVTVHDLTNVRYRDMCEPATLRFPELVRRAIARGAWVHTPSRFVAEEVVSEFGADPEKVRAVHHGAPLPTRTGAIPKSGEPERAGAPVDLPAKTNRYVLAVGTVEPRKDLPGLVRAFGSVASQIEDTALVLAGQDGWGSEALAQAIAASPVRDRIVRTGFVPDLEGLLRGAALLVYPSLYEGFGLPTLEAMAAGVPVVTTTAGALPEVVGDAAVMVEPRDTEALAAGIGGLLGDETQRKELIERGFARAAGFTWEACAKGLKDLYSAAAEERG